MIGVFPPPLDTFVSLSRTFQAFTRCLNYLEALS